MTKIHAPNKEYTGVVAGVSFNKGVGETEDKWLIGWFEEKGYKVEPEETEEEKKLRKEAEAKAAEEQKLREEAEELALAEAEAKAKEEEEKKAKKGSK